MVVQSFSGNGEELACVARLRGRMRVRVERGTTRRAVLDNVNAIVPLAFEYKRDLKEKDGERAGGRCGVRGSLPKELLLLNAKPEFPMKFRRL